MERANFDGVCAYIAGVWGRELSNLQRAAGWKLLHGLPNPAVEAAIDAIATGGREQIPPWSLIYKAAEAIAVAERDLLPALPAGDGLSDAEHSASMIRLRAKQSPEQRRRADRVTSETKGLPMGARLRIAQELLTQGNSRVAPQMWDALLDEALAREFQLIAPLVPVRADLA